MLTEEAAHLDWTRIAGVVIGASIHVGRHQRAVEGFVHRHRERLNTRPSAFFSVSLTASSTDPREVASAHDLARGFVTGAGWHPQAIACFPGRLAYSQYGFLKRLMVRAIARRNGMPTDATRDHELTRWDEVERFARDFATRVAVEQPQPA